MKQYTFPNNLQERIPAVSGIISGLMGGVPRISLRGLHGSARPYIISYLFSRIGKSIVYLTPSIDVCDWVFDDFDLFLPRDNFSLYLERSTRKDVAAYFRNISDYYITDTLKKLSSPDHTVIVTTPESLFSSRLPPPKDVHLKSATLQLNQDIPHKTVVATLSEAGYSREDVVEYRGDFSVRGCIIDFFPVDSKRPVRVEFFGNTITSLRFFNPDSQISEKSIEKITVYPIPDVQSIQGKLSVSLVEFLPKETLFVLHDSDLLETDPAFKKHRHLIENYSRLGLVKLVDTKHNPTYEIPTTEQPSSRGGLKEFKSWISPFVESGEYTISVFCHSREQKDRLVRLLYDLPVDIRTGNVSHGFILNDIQLGLLSDHKIFSRYRQNLFGRLSQHLSTAPVASKDALQKGDLVVHQNYGVGRYTGLKMMRVQNSTQECLAIEYKNNDKIFVPVTKLNHVRKYQSSSGLQPSLTRLRSTEWERIKMRTRHSTERLAKELINLYASRHAARGHPFSPDSYLQWEMEAEFKYEETPDQLQAIRKIKDDMEKNRPMDRLVCGDVGFGKTEVAIRAAFKAINDSKQVAILVPTTILAEQHERTFRERLQHFPVTIASLSRIRKRSQQTTILGNLASGSLDIIIGTHRLLSGDVSFHDLGLLIIDEEHRFGVKHKERLKKLRANVDTISLSATPIPRTLQMSLMGAREFSQIDTPPKERLPIITEITTFDKNTIARAIKNEINRGGQVYFVHNRIDSIHSLHDKLQKILPEVSFQVAHGRMRPAELENIMLDFVHNKFDCLISTTIIESGIDIPNVNTIIINNADRMGLAQLYQLRGRVGRSSRRAFAYLIIPPPKNLSHDTIKRIQTLARFTELGTGYEIARRDLEIRGAGNLFGTEQSGFIAAVGLDLYMKILKESISKHREQPADGEDTGEKASASEDDTEITTAFSLILPENYVPSPRLRVHFYQRLSDSTDIDHLNSIRNEIIDRFGPLPETAIRLFDVHCVRILAGKFNVERLHLREHSVRGNFRGSIPFNDIGVFVQAFGEAAKISHLGHRFIPGDPPGFYLKTNDSHPPVEKKVKYLLESLSGKLKLE